MGTTGVTGVAAPRVLVKGICAVDDDVKGGLWDVDGELEETGVHRKRTLIGVETGLGRTVSGLKSERFSYSCCFLMIVGMVLGFSKTGGGFGSGFDLVYCGFFLGASF